MVGETGCGKSTQVPQFILEVPLGNVSLVSFPRVKKPLAIIPGTLQCPVHHPFVVAMSLPLTSD